MMETGPALLQVGISPSSCQETRLTPHPHTFQNLLGLNPKPQKAFLLIVVIVLIIVIVIVIVILIVIVIVILIIVVVVVIVIVIVIAIVIIMPLFPAGSPALRSLPGSLSARGVRGVAGGLGPVRPRLGKEPA